MFMRKINCSLSKTISFHCNVSLLDSSCSEILLNSSSSERLIVSSGGYRFIYGARCLSTLVGDTNIKDDKVTIDTPKLNSLESPNNDSFPTLPIYEPVDTKKSIYSQENLYMDIEMNTDDDELYPEDLDDDLLENSVSIISPVGKGEGKGEGQGKGKGKGEGTGQAQGTGKGEGKGTGTGKGKGKGQDQEVDYKVKRNIDLLQNFYNIKYEEIYPSLGFKPDKDGKFPELKKPSISKSDLFVINFINDLPNKPYFNDIISTTSDSSRTSKYHHYVFELLEKEKAHMGHKDSSYYYNLQLRIENMTMHYEDLNEKSDVYKNYPNLINKFIDDNQPSAMEYIKNNGELSNKDLIILNHFDRYTLEGIMIYVLGNLFHSVDNEIPAVRVSTLIDQMDKHVRYHYNTVKSKGDKSYNTSTDKSNNEQADIKVEPAAPNDSVNCDQVNTSHKVDAVLRKEEKAKERFLKKVGKWVFGVLLVQFLEERKLIKINRELNNKGPSINHRGKYWYMELNHYAYCNFDINIIPIKLNLPMVCRPVSWHPVNLKESKQSGQSGSYSISDLRGGYLNMPTGDFYSHNRFQLLSSRDLPNFHIDILEVDKMCYIINQLQFQPFEINTDVLEFIQNNRKELENLGLLMPEYLKSLDIHKVSDIFRKTYLDSDASFKKIYKYNDMLNILLKFIQRARYESFIIEMASAYSGYQLYLPAFMDFRGRIYRSGVLHFHERDLARSLIVYSKKLSKLEEPYSYVEGLGGLIETVLKPAAAFHYIKLACYEVATSWYNQTIINLNDSDILNYAVKAKDPFQFISKVISIEDNNYNSIRLDQLPITQDASASAYQILSYYTLNKDLAVHTNLIAAPNSPKPMIYDIYSSCLFNIINYLPKHLDKNICDIVLSINHMPLNRDLIKGILMPMIYGKTQNSITHDLYKHYKTVLTIKECLNLASCIIDFFNSHFPGIRNLMNLICNIGWFCSALQKPVSYQVDLFRTYQDYVKSDSVNIWIYDSVRKKKRQVTLKIPTDVRNRRKSYVSTFVNFIHQKDAYIAMYMIDKMSLIGAPVYTVHDNFITNIYSFNALSRIYRRYFMEHNPLYSINEFLCMNLDMNLNNLEVAIHPSDLKLRLISLIPHNISKIDRVKWNKKIEIIYKSYQDYLYSTYKNEDLYDIDSQIIYRNFIHLLQDNPGKYSLHL